jgi:hypothetical protein
LGLDYLRYKAIVTCITRQAFETEGSLNDFGVKLFPSDPILIIKINFPPNINQTLIHFGLPSIKFQIPVLEILLGIVYKFDEIDLFASLLKLRLHAAFDNYQMKPKMYLSMFIVMLVFNC